MRIAAKQKNKQGESAMVVGTHSHTVDPKGRVFLPSKFRDDFGEVVFLAKSIDSCITAYPREAWSEITKKINSLPNTKAREYRRHFFSSASEVQVDSQGRILLPPELRDYAGIEKSVKIIGAGEYAEIWDETRLAQHEEKIKADHSLEEMLIELGL